MTDEQLRMHLEALSMQINDAQDGVASDLFNVQENGETLNAQHLEDAIQRFSNLQDELRSILDAKGWGWQKQQPKPALRVVSDDDDENPF